ncbi:hypothetical protein CY34DRAFT_445137 [Suillus luteus UH-Slu-Lm8-n1]|uniref:Unplaced genomic scaffold CY34scaffold_304, whole genome shotgun sequence n=1 Tax=Suillus luteus UH-Slu-Lm8-n1 TaxID=930992 RepID=A0A0D0A7T2_9AGAM|nr:hypothetical protein CY34DRAFT_445137 [Suillus luteus UH-Slu-Lm8-n1]
MVLYKVGKRMSAASLHHHYFFRERGEQFGRKEADHECTEACKSRKTHAIVVFVRLFVVALDVAFVPVFLVFFGGGATCGIVSCIGDCPTAQASLLLSSGRNIVGRQDARGSNTSYTCRGVYTSTLHFNSSDQNHWNYGSLPVRVELRVERVAGAP